MLFVLIYFEFLCASIFSKLMNDDYIAESDRYFLKENVYTGLHPNYFNKNSFHWVKNIENNYKIILDEINTIITGNESLPENINPPYLSSPGVWRNFYFMNFRWYDHKNCIKYPQTFALLSTIPNLSFAGITVLDPYSKVLPHIGETNATIRCHLGLFVPGSNMDCGIMVNGEKRAHENGKVIMFSDAHLHTTWNNTDEKRYLLVFDIVQQQFAWKSNWVCANALSALSLKYLDEKLPFIKSTPDMLLKIILTLMAVLWWIYLPVQKQFRYIYLLMNSAKKT